MGSIQIRSISLIGSIQVGSMKFNVIMFHNDISLDCLEYYIYWWIKSKDMLQVNMIKLSNQICSHMFIHKIHLVCWKKSNNVSWEGGSRAWHCGQRCWQTVSRCPSWEICQAGSGGKHEPNGHGNIHGFHQLRTKALCRWGYRLRKSPHEMKGF